MHDIGSIALHHSGIGVGRGFTLFYNSRQSGQRHVNPHYTDNFLFIVNRQAKGNNSIIIGTGIHHRVNPDRMSQLHTIIIPRLLWIGQIAECRRLDNRRVGNLKPTGVHPVNIDLKIFPMRLKIIGLKRNGTPHDVWISFHNCPAIGLHSLRLSQMEKQVPIDIACRLLNT